jgi:hypothetical protein
MAKKSTSKKPEYVWVWAKSTAPGKPTEAEKKKVTATFEPWIAARKAALPPLEQPQQFNQCVDVYSRWRGSYFYILDYFKVADVPNAIKEGFEYGVARLTYKAPGAYDLAAYRYTGEYFTILEDLSLEQVLEELDTQPFFEG